MLLAVDSYEKNGAPFGSNRCMIGIEEAGRESGREQGDIRRLITSSWSLISPGRALLVKQKDPSCGTLYLFLATL